jgi:hypothetical protein
MCAIVRLHEAVPQSGAGDSKRHAETSMVEARPSEDLDGLAVGMLGPAELRAKSQKRASVISNLPRPIASRACAARPGRISLQYGESVAAPRRGPGSNNARNSQRCGRGPLQTTGALNDGQTELTASHWCKAGWTALTSSARKLSQFRKMIFAAKPAAISDRNARSGSSSASVGLRSMQARS